MTYHRAYILHGPFVDSTNGGVTGSDQGAQGVILLDPDEPVLASVPSDLALLRLVPGNLPGCVKAIPVDVETGEDIRGGMFGGNFLTTSDSRFGEAVRAVALRSLDLPAKLPTATQHALAHLARAIGPVPVHDRIEG